MPQHGEGLGPSGHNRRGDGALASDPEDQATAQPRSELKWIARNQEPLFAVCGIIDALPAMSEPCLDQTVGLCAFRTTVQGERDPMQMVGSPVGEITESCAVARVLIRATCERCSSCRREYGQHRPHHDNPGAYHDSEPNASCAGMFTKTLAECRRTLPGETRCSPGLRRSGSSSGTGTIRTVEARLTSGPVVPHLVQCNWQ
jgi:hypothetical protein